MSKKIDSAGFGLKPKTAAAPVAPANQAAPQGTKRRKREQGEDYERLTVYLPAETAKQLRHYCVDARCSASDAITRAIVRLVSHGH
jgi:hypothetical protein